MRYINSRFTYLLILLPL